MKIIIYQIISLAFMFLVLIFGCKSTSNNYEYKFDARLRQLMSEKDSNQVISCTIQLTRNYDSEIQEKLEKDGVKILTNLVTIITAQANITVLRKIAAYDFIKFIEADKEIYQM